MKKYKRSEESTSLCKHYRKDTETCNIGCSSINVKKGNSCPWDNGEDQSTECPCYA